MFVLNQLPNYDVIDLGSAINPLSSENIYPLWVDNKDNKLIYEAKETDPEGKYFFDIYMNPMANDESNQNTIKKHHNNF